MITKTDENTKYVAALSKDTKKSTEHSYEEMKSLINAMDNINNSNAEISKIIKVIDEIAFQTNIYPAKYSYHVHSLTVEQSDTPLF